MIKSLFFTVLLGLTLTSCSSSNTEEQTPPLQKLDFDYTLHNLQTINDAKCEVGFTENLLSDFTVWQEQTLNRLVGQITPSDWEEYSHFWHPTIMRAFTEINNEDTRLLQHILDDLVGVLDQERIEHPRFQVFLVKPKGNRKIINAWVTGSHIYMTTHIITFLENDPHQIAGVLAHEIAHVILNHLSSPAQAKQLATKYLGKEWGQGAAYVYQKIIAGPTRQSLELEADLAALVLMNGKYDPFAMVKPLIRFSQLEPQDIPAFKKLFLSHPVSAVRVNCVSGALARAKLRAEQKQNLLFKN